MEIEVGVYKKQSFPVQSKFGINYAVVVQGEKENRDQAENQQEFSQKAATV